MRALWRFVPTNIGATRLPVQSWMGVYVATTHPLASQTNLQWEQLHTWRELRLNTYLESNANITRGPPGQRQTIYYC